MTPRYVLVAAGTIAAEQRISFVSLRVMHNNDEVNENDNKRDCLARCREIAWFNFQGELQSNGPI